MRSRLWMSGLLLVVTACSRPAETPLQLDERRDAGPHCESSSMRPGHTLLRRLNRAELATTLRGLLSVDTAPILSLPPDEPTGGYDNNTAGLSTSPLFAERWQRAVEQLVATALAPPQVPAIDEFLDVESSIVARSAGSSVEGLWVLPANGDTIAFTADLPVDGTYALFVRAGAQTTGRCREGSTECNACVEYESCDACKYRTGAADCDVGSACHKNVLMERPELDGPAELQFLVDGAVQLARPVVAGWMTPEVMRVDLTLTAGSHLVALRMSRDCNAWSDENRAISVDWLRLTAPVERSQSPLLLCSPELLDARTCLGMVASSFAMRAWRRAISPSELAPIVDAAMQVLDEERGLPEAFEHATALMLEAVLLSPQFLFRVELDETDAPHALTHDELAVRLAYFLWGTAPDDGLRAADFSDVNAAVRMMLADPRSRALAERFALQWLDASALDALDPSDVRFTGLDARALLHSMRGETLRLFDAFVHSPRSMLDLVDADFTYVDPALAQHYGIAPAGPVDDEGFARASLEGTPRRGLLSLGAVLTSTSNSNRTSPVRRGRFVLRQLLCDAPPPPPPGIPLLEQQANGSMRERLEAHRRQGGACQSCHETMDPIGLGLDNFDAVGRWRVMDDYGFPIDARGVLASGAFSSPRELAAVLKHDPRVAECMAWHMMTFALGRSLTDEDACALEQVASEFAAGGHTVEALVTAIVKSVPFSMRQREAP